MSPQDLRSRAVAGLPRDVLERTGEIIRRIESRGEAELRSLGSALDGLGADDPLIIGRAELHSSLDRMATGVRDLLECCAARIRRFATAQLHSLSEFDIPIPGGHAGQEVAPLARAGCYVPAGRYPLPTSLLMSVCTAKVAGVGQVLVASPHPGELIKGCAALAGADALIPLGGAQAIAAMGLGIAPIPACDLVAGPGNIWVTAAKRLLAGRVHIDMLAGPSELLIIADCSADPRWIAADLIAQAEHDAQARPMLIATDPELIEEVEVQIFAQCADLERALGSPPALAQSVAVILGDLGQIADLADELAPEHLQLMLDQPEVLRSRLHNYGSLFIGGQSAEVFGDYGVGPNHVLPTGGASRQRGGLSVFDFLRIRTWVQIDDRVLANPIIRAAEGCAALEGLPGHARAASIRLESTAGASPPSSIRDNC